MISLMKLTLLWYAGSWASPGLVRIRSNIVENEDRCMGLAGGASVSTHVLLYTHSCTSSPPLFTLHHLSLHRSLSSLLIPPCLVPLHCSGSAYYDGIFSPYRPGSGLIAMDNVQCAGTELNLLDCPHTANHNCHHREDVGIVCTNESRWLDACTCALPFPPKLLELSF